MEGSLIAGHGVASAYYQSLQSERINDIGDVGSICLPPRWIEMSARSFGAKLVRKFAPADFPDVRICSVLCTEDLGPVVTTNFQKILHSEFHDLDVRQIVELEDVLESVANNDLFEIEVIRTGLLNHRRILKVCGNWLRTNEKMIGGFFETDGTANHIQQLYFVAPIFHYHAFEADALESLLSVIWK